MSDTVIDLNADVGEGYDDGGILASVTSANVACGGHAGDDATMRSVCALAAERGVAIGAQVSYQDRAGFGRRSLDIDPAVLRIQIREQVLVLHTHATAAGSAVTYVKPHGALYHRVASDVAQAWAVVSAAGDAADVIGTPLQMLGLPGSVVLRVAQERGLIAVPEAFADRAYTALGGLVPRSSAGAVLADPRAVVERSVAIAHGREITDADGAPLLVEARSLCVHGDTPGAPALAAAVRAGLEEAGVEVAPFAPPRDARARS